MGILDEMGLRPQVELAIKQLEADIRIQQNKGGRWRARRKAIRQEYHIRHLELSNNKEDEE